MLNRSIYALLIGLIAACGQPEPEVEAQEEAPAPQTAIRIEATAHTASEGAVESIEGSIGERLVRTGEGEHWLALDVEVPAAGRYKVELFASAKSDSAEAWVEDYYDNPDDRTYNITGTIHLDPASADDGSQSVFTKVGSPLNEGLHRMKLHIKGSADIEALQFTLIRPHVPTPMHMTQAMDGDKWTLVWSDEFDGSGTPDTSKWTFDVGDWGWGNHELQYYTEARPKNARLEDGHLIIEAHKDDMGAEWTSARLTTRGKVAFTYGRIEFRAKVPAEKGNWAAGWTLGDNYIDEMSWPYCGEIDILESVGYEMDNETGDGKAHASVHCGAYYFKLGNQPTATIEVENMNNEWHTYSVDWSPERITASVDGIEYFSYDDTSSELSWPFDKPQNIILNLAMGGGWGGLYGMDETVTTQSMHVDYVRVYEKRK